MFKKLILTLLLCMFTSPLSGEIKILAFSGSTRDKSYNKMLVKEAAETARKMGAQTVYIDLADYPLPFYDGDLEAEEGMPENARKIRQMMIESNGIIIATPEYNGSISAVLKNLIDWTSRSEEGGPSNAAFKNKKFAIMSASPGGGGGARALKHLREILGNIGGQVIGSEVAVPTAHNAFDSTGLLKSPKLRQDLVNEVSQLFN